MNERTTKEYFGMLIVILICLWIGSMITLISMHEKITIIFSKLIQIESAVDELGQYPESLREMNDKSKKNK